MDKYMNDSNKIMNKIGSLVDEMGEDRFKQYMKAYLELNGDKQYFFEKFALYIDNCKKDRNGFRRISISSFKSFILGIPSIEELEEIWNNIDDPLDDI